MAENKATSEGMDLPAGQASEKPLGSTAVAEAKIDPSAIYILPTGEKALGKDVNAAINRGKGYQTLQSQLDKLKVEHDQVLVYANQLEQEKQQREEKERFTRNFEELSQLSKKATSNDDDEGYNGDDTGVANPISMERFMEKLAEIEGNLAQKSQVTIDNKIQEAIQQIFQQQEQANQINATAGNLDKSWRDALTAMYSHYADANPNESAKLFDEIRLKENAVKRTEAEGSRKANQNLPDWRDHFFEAQELYMEIGRLRGQAYLENEKAKEEIESKGVLGNTLGMSRRSLSENPKFSMRTAEGRKAKAEWQEKNRQEAKKIIAASQLANKVR